VDQLPTDLPRLAHAVREAEAFVGGERLGLEAARLLAVARSAALPEGAGVLALGMREPEGRTELAVPGKASSTSSKSR
jgi:hypothetical protein